MGKKDEERLLGSRKLALVVDLDQTMIHTTIELVPPDMKVSWSKNNVCWVERPKKCRLQFTIAINILDQSYVKHQFYHTLKQPWTDLSYLRRI